MGYSLKLAFGRRQCCVAVLLFFTNRNRNTFTICFTCVCFYGYMLGVNVRVQAHIQWDGTMTTLDCIVSAQVHGLTCCERSSLGRNKTWQIKHSLPKQERTVQNIHFHKSPTVTYIPSHYNTYKCSCAHLFLICWFWSDIAFQHSLSNDVYISIVKHPYESMTWDSFVWKVWNSVVRPQKTHPQSRSRWLQWRLKRNRLIFKPRQTQTSLVSRR